MTAPAGSAADEVKRALALIRAGRLEAAAEACEKALAADPAHGEALHALGVVHLRAGRAEAAVASLARAIAARPGEPGWLANLGVALRAAGRAADAVAAYRRALKLRPDFAEAHYNLANALRAMGEREAALGHYRRATEIAPLYAEAFNNLAECLREIGRFDEAEAGYRRALAADAASAQAHANLALLLRQQGHMTEALAHLGEALALEPGDGLRLKIVTAMPPIMPSHAAIAATRSRLEKGLAALGRAPLRIADPLREANLTTFYLAYHGESDLAPQRRLAETFRRASPELSFTAPHCSAPRPVAGRPIEVGFVSNKLRDHTIGRLNEGLIARLPRQRFRVTVLRFPHPPDALSAAIGRAADADVGLPDDLAAARRLIASAELDALVYTDVGMDPIVTFLAFARLAPVQCATWGHPDTTGIDTVDYFVSSVWLESEGAEAHYSETLVRLPEMSVYYRRPPAGNPERGRALIGLGAEETAYLCPQTLFKFHPDFDPILAAILRADPKGVLVLVEGQHANWRRQLTERLADHAPDVAARIRFIPPQPYPDFLAVLAGADVILDTPHFSGGNSSYEALAMATPIVTLPGRFLRGRITAALYRRMGLDDAIANDADDYVAKAVLLGTDRERRADLKARIDAASGVLFENEGAVTAWADFLERATAGGPPLA